MSRGQGQQCTARSKRSGVRCKNWAMRGASVCRIHGGAAAQVKAAAQRRLETADAEKQVEHVRAELNRLGIAVEVDPLAALEHALYQAVGNVAYLEQRLDAENLTVRSPLHGEQMHPLYLAYERERDRVAKFSKMALDAGISEKRVRIAEKQAEVLRGLMGRVLERLGIEPSRARPVISQELARLQLVESTEDDPAS
jgi:hypothetical protein